MKKKLLSLLLLAVVPLGWAQTNAPAPSSSGGLQINTQSEEERLTFLLTVGEAYLKEGDFESAVSAYERILEIDPMHRQARYVVSHVYINAKAYKKAEKLMLELINDFPEDFQLKNNLAWLYATAEDPAYRNGKKAVEYAQEAMILAPNDHHVWSTLSEAYYIAGEYEKAHRAIIHMATLASRYGGKGVTKESVDSYNEQIRKCKRALDTFNALKGDDEEE